MEPTPDGLTEVNDFDEVQPIRDTDATTMDDPTADAAQAEWEREAALDGTTIEDDRVLPAPRTDSAEAGTDEPIDRTGDEALPESQGDAPLLADLGEDGEGDLSPEDA